MERQRRQFGSRQGSRARAFTGVLAVALYLPPAAMAATAQDALQAEVQSQAAAAASQQRVDGLADDAKKALDTYRAALYKNQQLKLYLKELDSQVVAQTQEKVSLQQQLSGVDQTQAEIVPLMSRMIESLEKFVELDQPFLLEERRERVAKLKTVLHDPQMGVGEKYRRVLEAYQVEAGYGRQLETWRGDVKLDEGLRAVDFIKLGRVAVYYLTLDGESAGYWDAAKKQWIELSAGERVGVRHALHMAREDASIDLVSLPVPAPVKMPPAAAKAAGGKP